MTSDEWSRLRHVVRPPREDGPVLPGLPTDETDAGCGEPRDAAAEIERLRRDRPPHYGG